MWFKRTPSRRGADVSVYREASRIEPAREEDAVESVRGWIVPTAGSESSPRDPESGPLASQEAKQKLIDIIEAQGGHRVLREPIQLASGDWSRHFIDGKRALRRGRDLEFAARAILDTVQDIPFDAVGGLTMGADQFAHAVAVVADVEWFSVRKKAKERGTRQRIEGATLGPGMRVLLVDDVVTRGGSIVDAFEAITETGAEVVCAVTFVDRGRDGRHHFEERGIPFRPLLTYEDLGIPAVGDESGVTAKTG